MSPTRTVTVIIDAPEVEPSRGQCTVKDSPLKSGESALDASGLGMITSWLMSGFPWRLRRPGSRELERYFGSIEPRAASLSDDNDDRQCRLYQPDCDIWHPSILRNTYHNDGVTLCDTIVTLYDTSSVKTFGFHSCDQIFECDINENQYNYDIYIYVRLH